MSDLGHFAARVRARREALGLSQREVAIRVGTNQTQISLYETGRIETPKPGRLAKLAAALDMTVDELWGPTERPKSNTITRDAYLQLQFLKGAARDNQVVMDRIIDAIAAIIGEPLDRPEWALELAIDSCSTVEGVLERMGIAVDRSASPRGP